jgi:hypothetical protein
MKASIGLDVNFSSLSTEERDEKLKEAMLVARELHPALISPEAEYKVSNPVSAFVPLRFSPSEILGIQLQQCRDNHMYRINQLPKLLTVDPSGLWEFQKPR